VQLVVGTCRALGLEDVDAQFLESSVRDMGQDLFDPPSVKGWEGGRSWINANVLLTRYGALANLVDMPVSVPDRPRGNLDVIALLRGKEFKAPAEVVDYLLKCHLAVSVAAEKRKELIAYLGNLPPSSQWAEQRDEVNARLRGLLVLLFASPEYQMT
jgi:hypothetical protein